MKKFFIVLGSFLLLLVLSGVVFWNVRISESITSESLDPFVYDSEKTTRGLIVDSLNGGLGFSGFGDVGDATFFLNALIFHSIKSNVNEEYDPLNSECENEACFYIVDESVFIVDYIFAESLDENILLTVSVKREGFPSLETAVHLILDYNYEPSLLGGSITFTILDISAGRQNLRTEHLSSLLESIGENEINEMISFGSFSIEELKLTIPLTEIMNSFFDSFF